MYTYFITFVLLLQWRLSVGITYTIPFEQLEKDGDFWHSKGVNEIESALAKKNYIKNAKNVIVFVGDGMGISVSTAARIYKGQKEGKSGEEGTLIWDDFPNSALIKTYSLDKQVPDSAATATAFFSGVKINSGVIGVSGRVSRGNCSAALNQSNYLKTVLDWFQNDDRDTGIVTTTRITHATPAALYSKSADRDWECDSAVKNGPCKDIARQLVEDLPGKNVKVIFGGGRFAMGANISYDQPEDSCERNDSKNLAEDWKADKISRGFSGEYVTNSKELRNLDVENTEFILGLFSGSHLPYEHVRDTTEDGVPSLKELTEVAIRRLRKSEKGYFLMVEGGKIDHGLHDTRPRAAFEELLAMEEAVQTAVDMTDEEETLIIVTADHSHVMTINGYPDRGNDILGTNLDKNVIIDGLPYTTLMFTNGFAANYTSMNEKVMRANLTSVDTRDYNFHPQAAAPTKPQSETHGGEDIATYANGPFAHLLQGVREQTFIARVIAYSACVGLYECNGDEPPKAL